MRHYNSSSRTSLFAQNSILIGDRAWGGYLTSDRGMVVISSPVDIFDTSEAPNDRLELDLNIRYIPQLQLAIYLQEWLVPDRSILDISAAVANYQPQTELIFAIESSTNLDVGWCQSLKISPPDCYQQIQRRWSEFQLGGRG